MKKTQEILGLPIISVSDGMEVGRVKGIIMNAEKGAIDYIVVESGIQIFNPRVIPNDDILGIGEYALTIENEGVITDISKISSAIQLLQKDIQIKGTKVLTRKGRLIGEIGDVYVNENDGCKITGLEFIADINQNHVQLIPRESVITFGKNLTVVKEDAEASLLETPAKLVTDEESSEKKNDILESAAKYNLYEAESDAAAISDISDSPVSRDVLMQAMIKAGSVNTDTAEVQNNGGSNAAEVQISANTDAAEVQDNGGTDTGNAAMLFEQRQKQYLIGRRATKTISDSDGNIIIREGELIDDKAVDTAKAKNKLIELVMNNRA